MLTSTNKSCDFSVMENKLYLGMKVWSNHVANILNFYLQIVALEICTSPKHCFGVLHCALSVIKIVRFPNYVLTSEFARRGSAAGKFSARSKKEHDIKNIHIYIYIYICTDLLMYHTRTLN